jgi:hypothetical protein
MLVAKIADAESAVEISHRLLLEGLGELNGIKSSDTYIMTLKTKIKRLFDSESLHCQRAYDKISSVKDSIELSNLDRESKGEFKSITEMALESYLSRKNALDKASNAIDSLNKNSKQLPTSVVKDAMLSAEGGQKEAQIAAVRLASLCSKLGISPAQK